MIYEVGNILSIRLLLISEPILYVALARARLNCIRISGGLEIRRFPFLPLE